MSTVTLPEEPKKKKRKWKESGGRDTDTVFPSFLLKI